RISSRVRRGLRRCQGAADRLNSTVLCVFGTGYERRAANPSKSGRVQVCDRVQSVRSRDAGKPLGKTERDPKRTERLPKNTSKKRSILGCTETSFGDPVGADSVC